MEVRRRIAAEAARDRLPDITALLYDSWERDRAHPAIAAVLSEHTSAQQGIMQRKEAQRRTEEARRLQEERERALCEAREREERLAAEQRRREEEYRRESERRERERRELERELAEERERQRMRDLSRQFARMSVGCPHRNTYRWGNQYGRGIKCADCRAELG